MSYSDKGSKPFEFASKSSHSYIINDEEVSSFLKKCDLPKSSDQVLMNDKLYEDVEYWGNVALLHDFDWEIHPTMEKHPTAGEPILREQQVPEEIIRAVLSHANHTGIARETLMEKALFACDEITGLITAVALVRPSRALYDLKVKSIKKKWKDKSFAAGANREEIEESAEAFGIDLWTHVDNVIQAMKTIAEDLDLAGAPIDA